MVSLGIEISRHLAVDDDLRPLVGRGLEQDRIEVDVCRHAGGQGLQCLGAADFAASMGMQTTGIGGTQANYYMLHEGAKYWPDPWHWATTAIVAAANSWSQCWT